MIARPSPRRRVVPGSTKISPLKCRFTLVVAWQLARRPPRMMVTRPAIVTVPGLVYILQNSFMSRLFFIYSREQFLMLCSTDQPIKNQRQNKFILDYN